LGSSEISILADAVFAGSIQKTQQSYAFANARAPAYQYYETSMRDYTRGRQEVITIASD